jgi:membrane protein required for colicin V production
MDLGLTWFDFLAFVIVGLSAIMAFARGLIREVFTIIAFAAGILAALILHLAGMTRPLVEGVSGLSGIPADLAGGLGIFLIVFIAITIATAAMAKRLHQSTEIGSFDRAAGLAFGILRGIVFVAVLFVLPIRLLAPDQLENEPGVYLNEVVGARTYPIYSGVASALAMLIPRGRDRGGDISSSEGESAPIPPAESDGDSAAPAPQP